jgi:hypothetical protein
LWRNQIADGSAICPLSVGDPLTRIGCSGQRLSASGGAQYQRNQAPACTWHPTTVAESGHR